jgi:hypothetical protein
LRLAAGLLAALAVAPASVVAGKPEPLPPGSVSCDDGNITKKIAGTKWKMRGCSDGTLLFLFKENSPEKLAFLSIKPGESGYQISGGGKVDQPEVIAAANWAKSLTVPEIEALYAETQEKKQRKS